MSVCRPWTPHKSEKRTGRYGLMLYIKTVVAVVVVYGDNDKTDSTLTLQHIGLSKFVSILKIQHFKMGFSKEAP